MKIDKDTFGKFFDGTPGKTWDDYLARLKNAGAGEVDDRGYSIAAGEGEGDLSLRVAVGVTTRALAASFLAAL